jgi:hypothetical protein
MSDEEFLRAYRGGQETAADAQILETRRRIASELAFPILKIKPDDHLLELRDRYCLVVSGHLALGDLFDDLEAAGRTDSPTPRVYPETVREYIAASLDRVDVC